MDEFDKKMKEFKDKQIKMPNFVNDFFENIKLESNDQIG